MHNIGIEFHHRKNQGMKKVKTPEHSSHSKKDQARIYPKTIALILFIFAIVLALISLRAQVMRYVDGIEDANGLIPVMDVDRELSVPTMYSVQLLFLVTLILGFISILKHRVKDPFRWQWTILAFGFLYMAFDEGASIHELIVMPIRGLIPKDMPGFLSFSWIIPGILIVIFLFFYFIKFILALPRRTRILLLISAGVYLSGLIGMEMVGGNYADTHGIQNLTYNVLTTIEETFEMVGPSLFIYTLLDYIAHEYGGIIFLLEK